MLIKAKLAVNTLELVEGVPGDPLTAIKATRERRQPVTDLALHLETQGGVAITDALSRANGQNTGRRQTLLKGDLILVWGGRLHVERRIACGGWLDDIALCRTECDGSAFALVRKPQVPALFLVVGRLPDANGDEAEGFRINGCLEEEGRLEQSVRPRSGAKVAEMELVVP